MVKHLNWYTIRVDKSLDHIYKYEIFEVNYKYGNGDRQYDKKESRGEVTKDLDEAEPIGTGSIKFDGCSNWDFKPNNVLLHLCGEEKLDEFYEVLKECYNIADEIITI